MAATFRHLRMPGPYRTRLTGRLALSSEINLRTFFIGSGDNASLALITDEEGSAFLKSVGHNPVDAH
jgi:hypothetical protein